MNPLILVALAGIVYFAWNAGKTAVAVKFLRYDLKKVQIYRLKLTQPIVVRVFVDFVNLEDVVLTVQQINLDIFLNFANNESQQLATIIQQNFTIPANSSVSKYFDVEIRWAKLGGTLLKVLQGLITGGGVNTPTAATVKGYIRAKNITVPIEKNVPFSINN